MVDQEILDLYLLYMPQTIEGGIKYFVVYLVIHTIGRFLSVVLTGKQGTDDSKITAKDFLFREESIL